MAQAPKKPEPAPAPVEAPQPDTSRAALLAMGKKKD